MFALVTRSHERLLNDWFLRSLPTDCRPIIHFMESPPAVFREGRWHDIFIEKVTMTIEAIRGEPEGALIVISDVDIQFFKQFSEEVRILIDGRHLLFQNNLCGRSSDPLDLCAGFVVVRCGPMTLSFFETALRIMVEEDHPEVEDQITFRRILPQFPQLRPGLLPDRFWTHADMWKPGDPIDPPYDIVLHHANWVLGNEDKIKQLTTVSELINSRRRT